MSLAHGRVEARLPAKDLARAKRWYAEKLGLLPAEERDGGLRYECAGSVFCLFESIGFSDGGRETRLVAVRPSARTLPPEGEPMRCYVVLRGATVDA